MSISVSIVEDDAQARQILADWIRRAEGFHCVSEHGSAESALAALAMIALKRHFAELPR